MKLGLFRFLLTGLALCSMHEAGAADLSYPELLVEDVKYVVTAPARWEEKEWKQAGWASLAVVGTALVVDRPLRDEMRRHTGDDPFITQVERFGVEYAAATAGLFFLEGELLQDEKSVSVAQDIVTASFIASGLITPAIKLVAGRSRPRDEAGVYNFQPFTVANSSFPSGHTTEAFALASVIANHYDETWVSITAYSTASIVGYARSYHRAHFASDILAGAMIGTLVGKTVVAHNADLKAGKVVLLPEVGEGLIGVRLVKNF